MALMNHKKATTGVATTLYNNYKFLLLSLGRRFLSSDVVKLKDWASQNFSIENYPNEIGTEMIITFSIL
jgi:hypothetical protein